MFLSCEHPDSDRCFTLAYIFSSPLLIEEQAFAKSTNDTESALPSGEYPPPPARGIAMLWLLTTCNGTTFLQPYLQVNGQLPHPLWTLTCIMCLRMWGSCARPRHEVVPSSQTNAPQSPFGVSLYGQQPRTGTMIAASIL